MPYYNSAIHHRKSIRLKGYDYSQPGYYFVTINLDNIRCMLAVWKNGGLELLPIGAIATKYWKEIPEHYPGVEIDEYVIMPEHMHGIIKIVNGKNDEMVGARHGVPLRNENNATSSISHQFQRIIPRSIGTIINQYKGAVTRWCHSNGCPQFKWQRGFFEHIIRNEDELQRIQHYIRKNTVALQTQFPGLKG